MAIEITGLPTSSVQTKPASSNVLVARTEPTPAQQATGSLNSAETITLSDFAQQLRHLENSLGTVPVLDTQRVDNSSRALVRTCFERQFFFPFSFSFFCVY